MDLLESLTVFCKDKSDKEQSSRCVAKIKEFNRKNNATFNFDIFNKENHEKVLELLFELINDDTYIENSFRLDCLSMIRLLSRDKNLVTSIQKMNDFLKHFMVLLKNRTQQSNESSLCQIEALKCLCNWIYHSPTVRRFLIDVKFMREMVAEIIESNYLLWDYLFYQIRIMFLMSALESEERNNMIEYNTVFVLVKVLEVVNNMTKEPEQLSDVNKNILCEVLKALFNITLELSNVSSEKLISDFSELVLQLQFMLTRYNSEECDDVVTHICHLLVNLPKEALQMLCSEVNKKKHGAKDVAVAAEVETTEKFGHQLVFQGYDMTPVIILLSTLEKRVKIKHYVAMKEKTLAVLTAFCYVCRMNRLIRKYLRKELLPPLVVSDIRPEERKDTRGDIVRLMTTVDVPLKNMAADFIFVLCKENTTRLIRYTGYGNSAGYLSSRGLMIPSMYHVDGDYSEDELTDIDDDNLDVMIGAAAQPKQDVFANLTEEEKEEEAEKLMNMIQQLKDMNVIKPMVVDNQGKITEMKDRDVDDSD